MKKLILLVMAIMPYVVFAQKAKLEFEETSHNFGTISEKGGKAVHNFVFKNIGDAPLILTNVRAGCGCTTPEWNRQPVAPGEKGNIKVSFDPLHRPGSFIKSVTVNSNAINPVISLTIRGNVSRKPAGPYDAYQFSAGPIKMMTSTINLGTIKNTQQIEKSIEIVNTDNKTVNIALTPLSPNITATVTPATLQEGEKSKIIIQYDAQKKNEWGFVTDEIKINIDEKEAGKIIVAANINEDFSQYNGNYEKAPVITLSETSAQLDNLPKSTTQTHDFYIQNNGKSDLIIRKIKTSDEYTKVHLAKNTIKAGKKAKVTVTFTTGESSQITKIIQFRTNDPQNAIISYKINGTIK